jgi:hypothetical protein
MELLDYRYRLNDALWEHYLGNEEFALYLLHQIIREVVDEQGKKPAYQVGKAKNNKGRNATTA